MNVRIQALHFEISERLTEFINKKALRLARRFNELSDFDVTLKILKPETARNKEVFVRLSAPGMPETVAQKTADTFEEAYDTCLEALDRQLEKQKDRK